MSFVDKTIIVTGASSGIGAATAKRFLSLGAKVLLVARNREQMEEMFSSYNSNQLQSNRSIDIMNEFFEVLDSPNFLIDKELVNILRK